MSVTSIMHCRHAVTSLLNVHSSEENGVGKDAINTQQSCHACLE